MGRKKVGRKPKPVEVHIKFRDIDLAAKWFKMNREMNLIPKEAGLGTNPDGSLAISADPSYDPWVMPPLFEIED